MRFMKDSYAVEHRIEHQVNPIGRTIGWNAKLYWPIYPSARFNT
jgi:hypothetical protein